MINRLKNVLENMQLDGWHIINNVTNSQEAFLIKENIDMVRSKDVNQYTVTVYKNFDEFTGSSEVKIEPTMTDAEITSRLESAKYAATFVKNKYFELPKPSKSNFKSDLPSSDQWLNQFVDVVASKSLNSSEVFVNNKRVRVLNSEGIDVSYENKDVFIEVISHASGDNGEVESYQAIRSAAFVKEAIDGELQNVVDYSVEKANAQQTPNLDNINVILTGSFLKNFFGYYLNRTSVRMKYEDLTTYEINKKINDHMSENLSITLDPHMVGSTFSKPYDSDGIALEKTTIIENNEVKSFWGPSRFSYYLGVKPVGNIGNLHVAGGQESLETLKTDKYVEILEFSSFSVDPITGNFGGEIRLARYFDGQKIIPITTGSFTSELGKVEKEMRFSKETIQHNNYIGPVSVLFKNQKIAGN